MARLAKMLSSAYPRRHRRAIVGLREYLLMGRVGITTDLFDALMPHLADPRGWVRRNAVAVLIDLESGDTEPIQTLRSVLIDSDGITRLDLAFCWPEAESVKSPGVPDSRGLRGGLGA
jgi:hypothetical protein